MGFRRGSLSPGVALGIAVCGIAGLSLRAGSPDLPTLARLATRLGHRGPDDAGTYVSGNVGLAHSRLSIIDLAGGHQPLFAEDSALALVVNGEIYNHLELREDLERRGHRFTTRSDSEVLLHAYVEWGEGFLAPVCGMFAFALYDHRRRLLRLGRDRLGIKPLFIQERPEGLAFASEIKALLALDGPRPGISPQGLVEYLQNQHSSGRITVLAGIERVLPGELLTITDGRIQSRHRYWTPWQINPLDIGPEEALRRFEPLMETVICQHLRADVPFGLFLSGGVDSAILLALLHRYHPEPVRTFSVGFSNQGLTDELPMAGRMARQFGAIHTELRPSQAELWEILPLTVWAADDLMRDYASLPTALLARRAALDVKMVLSGEGGDEVFAGYGRYRQGGIARYLKNLLSPGSGGFRTRGTFRFPWPGRLFRPALRDVLENARAPVREAWAAAPGSWSNLQRMQGVDLSVALPDNLLVKNDRMLMAFGLEGRVPFCDHRLVEFGLALPDRLKVAGGLGKVFLKRWASPFLPHELLYAQKRGFHVPMGAGFTPQRLAQWAVTLPQHPALIDWFEPQGVRQLLMLKTQRQRPVHHRMIFALLQLALWYDLFVAGDGHRPEEP
ncbi:MAG: asparagine synthase (glutamine-hydrolyzing) [Pseudomonadota bacterium]